MALTDQFNGADTQTCNYAHDDLTRIASANCGAAASQTFSYDPFGNISKSGSPYSFQPTYSTATNRFATIPGATPSYDANGNVLGDGNHNYAWDADGNSVTLDTVGLTFDALDRMVEQNRSGAYTEIVYGPGGGKLALMNGQSLVKAFVPLPGGVTAVYTSSGLDHYRHSDWLGSARLTSSPSRTYVSSVAYAPYAEPYASSGTQDLSFTGEGQDTVSDDYDFLFREYSIQGRWPSPDPAGLVAVDPSNPQSWNRYAYIMGNPLALTDPLGLCGGGEDDGTSCQPFSFMDGNGCTVYVTYVKQKGSDGIIYDIPVERTVCSGGCPLGWRPVPYTVGGTGGTWCIPGRQAGDYVKEPRDRDRGDSSGGSTLDDRANALANAINKTGVQSLGNPCTVGAFYGSSAATAVSFGGTAAGATFFPKLNGAMTAFKATAVGKLLPYVAVASAAAKFAGFFNRASDAVQRGCNALQ